MPYQIQVGSQVVEFPDSVGQDEAQRILSEQFPATGEDIAGAMQDPAYKPSVDDYLKFEEYSKNKQTDWINTIAQSVDAAAGMIGGAISQGAQGAIANPLNYIEGAAQGTRQLYGLVAQSQDPGSPLFKFKDLVAGTGTPESRYQQFLEARDFANTTARLERGEEGLVVPPELTNPQFVQGVSMILDPTLALPGIGEVFGAGKLATRAVGKGAQLTGRAIAGAARPLERFAGAAERMTAEALGMAPEALRNTAATAGIAGALGIAPEAAAFAAIPAGIRTAREAGEALTRAGENLMTQPSRIGPLEAIGAAPGANLRQRMLGVVGQYGGDAALDASLRGLAGGIEGATVGTGLGFLSGGEEGAAAGLGSGLVQGAAGALGARGFERLTGKAAKEARAGDLGRFIDAQQDPTTKALFQQLRDRHGVDAASSLMDLQGLVRGKFGDVEVEYLSSEDFAKRYKINARGVQVENKGGRPAVVINADIIGKGTGDGPLYTLGHELFHALEKSTQLEAGATEIKNALVGRWIQEGDTIRKLAEGAFNDAEIEAKFNEYRDKLGAGNASMAAELAKYDTVNKKADYVASELAAEHFAGLLAGQKPDALLKGFTGLTRQLLDLALTQNASRALADAAATIERTFGVKPTDSVLFPDLKQASPQVNAMLRDLLRARRKLDEKIKIQGEQTKVVLKPEDVSNPLAAKQLVELGLAEQMPDGTIRSMSSEEVVAREEKDRESLRAIIENTPGTARMVDGVAQGRLSPEQLSAIEQSQAVSSRMKDKIRAANAAMDAGNSLNITYSAALKKIINRLTGKKVNRYSSGIRLTDRDVLPYAFYFSQADHPLIKAIDISKVRDAILKDTASNGSVGKGLWDNVDGFMGDLAKYFTNLDQKEGARRSAEIFGLEKAKYLGDFINQNEKFVRDFRLDRIGSVAPSGFRARFSEEAYQLSKQRWMPAEKLGDKSVINSDEGYRIISGAKHKLYGPDGKLVGIYDTQTQAERKADATQARLQPEVRQQQYPARDEVRQAAEAGGRNRAVGGQEGQAEGGAVRQAGDVRFMPAEEDAARKQVAESLPRRASFEAQGVTRDEGGNIFFKGKEPKDWTPTEFEEYGKAFGVPNLGPLSEIANIPSDVAGNPARIPGGLEGKFTYYDLLWLKANPVDVANLPETTHAKLTAKLASTMAPTPGEKVSSFNSIVFGMLSPNAPLLPNEMGQSRLRFGSMEDVRKFADLYPENPTKENLKELNQRLKKELGFISAGKGGLGIAITADISNIVNAARLFTKNPDFFVKKANESWADFVDKLTTQVKGFGTKTGSFGSVWQDPLKASISAMDRHMARIFGQELLGNPELRKRFEGIVVDRFNSMLKKSKEATSAFNRRLKNAEEKGKRIVELNKNDEQTLKKLKAKNDKRINKIKKEMASTLDSLPDPTATRAKTIDDVLGQAQIYGADRVQKFVNEAVFAAMGSRKATLLLKKGGINPKAPEFIKSVDWVETPKDFQVMSDSYRSALEINERRANELGVAVFPAQWTLWDRIRGRVEPHEVMFPGLEKLPALNDRQLGEAQKANKAAGYGTTPEAGEKWKRRQIDSPSRLAYFMPAGGEKLYEQTTEQPGRRGDRGEGRYSSGNLAPLAGAPQVKGASGPDQSLVGVAEQYAKDNGINLRRQSEYVEVDEDRARRIAQAYDEMPHAPQDPAVREAYQDLIRQTTDQYRALDSAGYKFWFIDINSDAGQQYVSSPFNAMRDLRANKSMGVFPTDSGFGTKEDFNPDSNPMLAETGLRWPFGGPNGELRTVYANDLFRAVHDAFGHGLEGSGFRAQGEENAWQAHIRLFTGPARGAITTETRGQNSWLNYGPYGERNRTAKTEDTVFADQKTGLMPEWTWTEGRAADEATTSQGEVGAQRYMPSTTQREVGRNVDFANPPTEEKAKAALSSSKQPFWREHESLPEGSPVGVRIDIPAFLNRGTYVQTIHEPATPGNVGDRIGYDTNVRLSGPVRFFVKEGSEESKFGAVAIKEGRAAKHPIATVEGKLIKDRSIPSDIETWTPVGMDPKKHSYFYDKRTDKPVTGGSESFSVGNTVFVKDPVYGNPQDFRYMPAGEQDTKALQMLPKPRRSLDAAYQEGVKTRSQDPQYYDIPDYVGYDMARTAAFEMGREGAEPPRWVMAERIGKLPTEGRSKNFAEDKMERGVSALRIVGEPQSDVGTYEMFNPGEKRYIAGWLVGLGSDGEPLLADAVDLGPVAGDVRMMPQPDSAMPGAYSFQGGYRAIPGKTKGSLRLYGPAGSLIGIASSLDEAQRILRRKTK